MLDLFRHLLLLLSIALLTPHIKADCVMYDVCNSNGYTDQNCISNGTAYALNDEEAEEILLRRCPDFYTDPSVEVCCTPGQVLTMENSIQMAEGIFGRCQTCLKNLMKSICGLACDPNQSNYVSILETVTIPIFETTYVSSVEYRIDLDYKQRTYDSCKEVIHPASGKQAMELACGTEASQCTPDRWFYYMGDPPTNPLVPFKIEYVNSDDSSIRFEAETKKCEEAYDGSYACSCVDCAETCPLAEPPLADDPGYLLFNLNGTTFIIAIVIGSFGVIAIIFASTVLGRYSMDQLPQFLGGFEDVDKWLSKFFRWWGRSKLSNAFNCF